MRSPVLSKSKMRKFSYIGCLPGSFVRRDCKLSRRVPKMVIFLRIAEEWRWLSGPEVGNVLRSEIMPLISSANFDASLYSFIHESEEDDAIFLQQKRMISCLKVYISLEC